MGTAVYSLGIVGGISAALKSFTHGEIAAVKRTPNIPPKSAALPPQAIIRDKDTWIVGARLRESLEGLS